MPSAEPNATDILQTIFVGGQLLLLAVAAVIAWWQLKSARALRDEETRPFVVVQLDSSSRPKFFDLVIKNLGATMARDIRCTFEPPLETSGDYVDIQTLKAFREGIGSLAPGAEFRTLLDFGPPRHDAKLPDEYEVTVSYRGVGDRSYTDVMDLDFGLFWDRMSISVRDLHDIHSQLEKLVREVSKWSANPPPGLLAVDPQDLRERVAELERRLPAQRSRE